MNRIIVCLVSVLTLAVLVFQGNLLESGQSSSDSFMARAVPLDLGWG
ncbi:hypothetical protein U5640_21660 [Streptomyces sp. SS7]